MNVPSGFVPETGPIVSFAAEPSTVTRGDSYFTPFASLLDTLVPPIARRAAARAVPPRMEIGVRMRQGSESQFRED